MLGCLEVARVRASLALGVARISPSSATCPIPTVKFRAPASIGLARSPRRMPASPAAPPTAAKGAVDRGPEAFLASRRGEPARPRPCRAAGPGTTRAAITWATSASKAPSGCDRPAPGETCGGDQRGAVRAAFSENAGKRRTPARSLLDRQRDEVGGAVGEGIDRLAGVDAERGGEDRSVHHVEIFHPTVAQLGIHHADLVVLAHGAAAHLVGAEDRVTVGAVGSALEPFQIALASDDHRV